MPKTSLITFKGNDYDLLSCFGAFNDYCMKCAENHIVVDLFCPNCKSVWRLFEELKLFENVIIQESIISENEYYFEREIEPPNPTRVISLVYEKYLRRSLGLKGHNKTFLFQNEIETLVGRNIRSSYGKRAFNIVNFSESFYSNNRMDVNITITNISERTTFSLGSTNISGTVDLKLNGMMQLITLMSSANLYIGQDSITSQIALNIGIPCFILTSSKGKCRIKQDSANVIYGRRCNVTPTTYQKLIGIWQTLSVFN